MLPWGLEPPAVSLPRELHIPPPGEESYSARAKGPGLVPGVGTNERHDYYGNGEVGSLLGRPNVN